MEWSQKTDLDALVKTFAWVFEFDDDDRIGSELAIVTKDTIRKYWENMERKHAKFRALMNEVYSNATTLKFADSP